MSKRHKKIRFVLIGSVIGFLVSALCAVIACVIIYYTLPGSFGGSQVPKIPLPTLTGSQGESHVPKIQLPNGARLRVVLMMGTSLLGMVLLGQYGEEHSFKISNAELSSKTKKALGRENEEREIVVYDKKGLFDMEEWKQSSKQESKAMKKLRNLPTVARNRRRRFRRLVIP